MSASMSNTEVSSVYNYSLKNFCINSNRDRRTIVLFYNRLFVESIVQKIVIYYI